MTYEQIIKDLKNKVYKPIYFLMGSEPYFIDQITNYIGANVLTESEKSFNQTVVYGKDIDARALDNMARRFPMMSEKQVVIVREAHHLKKIEDLVYYAGKPSEKTVLVLNYKYKTLDKRKKLYKTIQKNGILFESKKLYDNKIPAWIEKFLTQKKYSISPEASQLMAEYIGNDLNRIANELDKLMITVPASERIQLDHIEKNIGISKEFNNFELQKAITQRNVLKANQIINYFEQNPKDNPIILTIISLFGFFQKILNYHFLTDKSQRSVASTLQINPFFVKDYQQAAQKYNAKKVVQIISLLREYDMKAKGVGNLSATHSDLLRELIYQILH